MDRERSGGRAPLRPDFSERKFGGKSVLRKPSPAAPGEARDARERRVRPTGRLIVVAAVWSLGLLLAALILPVYNGETVSNTLGTTFVTETIVAGKGAWVLLPLAVPLVATIVVAVALRQKRLGHWAHSGTVAWSAVGLLAVFALITILSIGAFVIPVVLLLAAGVARTPARSRISLAAVAPTAPRPGPAARPG